jgi:hypothetical protein
MHRLETNRLWTRVMTLVSILLVYTYAIDSYIEGFIYEKLSAKTEYVLTSVRQCVTRMLIKE